MSTPELPVPGVRDLSGQYHVGYTADQMREMYRAGRLAGLEEAAKDWETAHGFDKHGVATRVRSLKEKQG
jgi:hypothetical protein